MFAIILNDQNVWQGSKNMASYKVFLWLSVPQGGGKLTRDGKDEPSAL